MPPSKARKERVPLTEATFHILLALADRDRHGYAIMREVEIRTSGKVRLGAGTLYGSLKRLCAEGLVEDAGERTDSGEPERRRYYRLTALGRSVARAEATRLASTLRLARSLRLLSPDVI